MIKIIDGKIDSFVWWMYSVSRMPLRNAKTTQEAAVEERLLEMMAESVPVSPHAEGDNVFYSMPFEGTLRCVELRDGKMSAFYKDGAVYVSRPMERIDLVAVMKARDYEKSIDDMPNPLETALQQVA